MAWPPQRSGSCSQPEPMHLPRSIRGIAISRTALLLLPSGREGRSVEVPIWTRWFPGACSKGVKAGANEPLQGRGGHLGLPWFAVPKPAPPLSRRSTVVVNGTMPAARQRLDQTLAEDVRDDRCA